MRKEKRMYFMIGYLALAIVLFILCIHKIEHHLTQDYHEADILLDEEEIRAFETFWQRLEKVTCIRYTPLQAHKLFYVWKNYIPEQADERFLGQNSGQLDEDVP